VIVDVDTGHSCRVPPISQRVTACAFHALWEIENLGFLRLRLSLSNEYDLATSVRRRQVPLARLPERMAEADLEVSALDRASRPCQLVIGVIYTLNAEGLARFEIDLSTRLEAQCL
jgi:hypothetical protein